MLHGALTFEDGWRLVEDQLLESNLLAGALFTTSDGRLGVRGRRREPLGDGGLVLATGCYETRPYAHPEPSFGIAERYQTIVPVTDPTGVEVRVDGRAVTPTTGTWTEHRRTLDLRTGTVTTTGRWGAVEVRSRRLVALDDGAIWTSVEVEPLDGERDVSVTLLADAHTGARTFAGEPEALTRAWGRVFWPMGSRQRDGGTAGLVHRTGLSHKAIAAAVTASVAGELTVGPDRIARRIDGRAGPGHPLVVHQRAALAVGPADGCADLLDRAIEAATAADPATVDAAVDRQRRILDEWWEVAAVDLDIDGEQHGLQAQIRFATFQVLQATARLTGEAVAAKGLTGQGYEGHHMWDQEIYLGQALSLLRPEAARTALSFRCRTLTQARRRATHLSHRGAQYPWRTIDGNEASAFFPAGAAQYHVNADIAWAIDHHLACTGDDSLLDDGGLEMLIETARFWMSLGRFNDDGEFNIDGVTGPDEYTALVDNNLYTNLMAARNLECAADHLATSASKHPDRHRAVVDAVDLDPAEPDEWRRAAAAVIVPRDEDLGVHGQDDGFLERPKWDLAGTRDQLPLQDHYHLLTLYRHQVLKQADVVLASLLLPERFTPEQRARDFDYYEPLTTHDSSLSLPIHAIVAAGLGRLDTAMHYLRRSAAKDLDGDPGTLPDGLHLAAAAGSWLAVARGLGGFDIGPDGVACFRPCLPEGVGRLRFAVRFQGSVIEVVADAEGVRFGRLRGPAVTIRHDGEPVVLS